MIDPQAKPGPYIKLMAARRRAWLDQRLGYVCLCGPRSSGHGSAVGTSRPGAGHGPAPLHLPGLHHRRLGGRAVGEALWRSQRHLCRSNAGIWQDRALRLSQRARDRDHRLCVAHRRRQSGPEAPLADACGGIGTLAADRLKLDEQETRTMGYSGVSGMLAAFITSPIGGALLGLESAQGGTGGRQTYFWVLFPSLLASAVATVVFVLLSGTFLRDAVQVPGLYAPPGGSVFRRAAGFDRRGGWRAVHVFAQTPAAALPAHEAARRAARAGRRPGHGDHRRAPAADVVFGRGTNG